MGRLFVPESLTVEVGPDIFHKEVVFDLGGPSVVAVRATLLAADPDGLEWGEEEGKVSFGLAGAPTQSADGVSRWLFAIGTEQEDYKGVGSFPFALTYGAFVTSRFVRVGLGFFAWPGAVDYEGEDHPTATVRIDVAMG